jgi:hypothetical protein
MAQRALLSRAAYGEVPLSLNPNSSSFPGCTQQYSCIPCAFHPSVLKDKLPKKKSQKIIASQIIPFLFYFVSLKVININFCCLIFFFIPQ